MPASGWWASIKQFVDYLQYKWSDNVVGYDLRDRENFLRSLDNGVLNAVYHASELWRRIKAWSFSDTLAGITSSPTFWHGFLTVLKLLMVLLLIVALLAMIFFALQQRRLRKRAAHIGLDALPLPQQLRLARQLAFFDQLTQALYRRKIVRPRGLTPMEFANSLLFLPWGVYDSIRRLTQIFYRVRFGGMRLSSLRQRKLQGIVSRIGQEL